MLHTDNSTEFREVVAVIDAISNTKRELRNGAGGLDRVPALNVSFSVN